MDGCSIHQIVPKTLIFYENDIEFCVFDLLFRVFLKRIGLPEGRYNQM